MKLPKEGSAALTALVRLVGKDACDNLCRRFPGFQPRAYQAVAARKAVKAVRSGNNALLLLDPGLGKTLVAQVVFLTLRRRARPRPFKALVLVPSRLLRDQHARAASWLVGDVRSLNLDASMARVPTRFREAFRSADWVVSTPRRLWNALDRDYQLRRLLRQIDLCVVDEFDAQAAEDMDAEGEPVGRLSQAATDLVDELARNGATFLCMSATTRAASREWFSRLKLSVLTVPEDLIGDHAAFARIVVQGVDDARASMLDKDLSLIILDTLRLIREAATGEFLEDPELDADSLIRQGSFVLLGRRHHIYLGPPLRRRIPADDQIRAYLGRLLKASSNRLALYEGRLEAVSMETYERYVRDPVTLEHQKINCVKNIEYQRGVSPSRKLATLVEIVKTKLYGTRGLVLVRNTDVNAFVTSRLRLEGLQVARMVGEMSDDERRRELREFENERCDTLVVNRGLGGRGFDLPKAQYAVFMSPKRSEETMWQELLRIRSTLRNPKEAVVLYYSESKEAEKMAMFANRARTMRDRYDVVEETG